MASQASKLCCPWPEKRRLVANDYLTKAIQIRHAERDQQQNFFRAGDDHFHLCT